MSHSPAGSDPSLRGAFPSAGNRLRLLVGGSHTREEMLAAIDNARQRVWLETFILMPDGVGRTFIDALARAARRGVQVIVVADQKGSALFGLGFHRRLLSAGVHLYLYNPLPPWRHLGRKSGRIRDRDHRKVLVADDLAFCGGHNLATAYLGSRKPQHYDITLKVEGPAVRDLARVFLQTLEQVADIRPSLFHPPAPVADGAEATVQIMDRRNGFEASDDAMRELIRGAEQRCYLMIAYLLPERWLLTELQEAAARDVDVRVVVAGKTDFPPVRAAVRHLYDDLVPYGVRVFEMRDQKLHAKVAVADARNMLVGTFDYNRFSAAFSLEATVTSTDIEVAGDLEALILASIERSREVTPADLARRSTLARLIQKTALRAIDIAATRMRDGESVKDSSQKGVGASSGTAEKEKGN